MAEELITVQDISIEPNNCELENPIKIRIEFTVAEFIANAVWRISFLADQAGARKIIDLGSAPEQDYAAGSHTFEFENGAMDVAHVKRHVLANVGLLQATLQVEGEEKLTISMVTQVTPGADGQLIRSVYNPLE